VHPREHAIAGVHAYPKVDALPVAPELAVICTPATEVPGVVEQLAARGTRAAVILTAGLAASGPLLPRVVEAAGRSGLRILGPNCIGMLVPGAGVQASFAHIGALPGRVAFVSQSGALCTAVLDWAAERQIGFSHFVSLGDSADVDAADLLDYLGSEPHVEAILLYLESVRNARKFLSAARAAARNKPVIAVKAGRVAAGARAAASHTGALAGADDVYDAALRRAGVLRVLEIEELFDAAETLQRARTPRGDRLAILTNGGGPGVMATDAWVAAGGRLAELAPATLAALDALLPATWSRANPVDMIGDAPPERFARALEILAHDTGVDAVLVLHAPTAIAPSPAAASAVAELWRKSARATPLLTSWLGGSSAEAGRAILRAAGVPTYDTPSGAIHALQQMLRHRRSQEMLIETPPTSAPLHPRTQSAREVIARARAEGRSILYDAEALQILDAFAIPVVAMRVAEDAEAAVRGAREIGFPVALKIRSAQVSHKTDVGGVALDLESEDAVRSAADALRERVAQARPDARLAGYTVQRMVRPRRYRELIVGIGNDPTFGPVILFGEGGTDVERIADRALGLPPLNLALARHLVEETRISRRLGPHRGQPGIALEAVLQALVSLSELATELPEIAELDVNPLLADEDGVLALDARVKLDAQTSASTQRLAIRPYPRELEEEIELPSGLRVLLRPIRPEDAAAQKELFTQLDPEDVRFRFFNRVREMPRSQLARTTQIDYDREMAFIALEPGSSLMLGEARAIADSGGTRAEFAILVRSDLKGHGMGYALLSKLIGYCRERGMRELVGQVLPDNKRMLELAESLGFKRRMLHLDGQFEVRLALDSR
jgi:acetyltransferase